MNNQTSYIVSILYHKIGDSAYEVLEHKWIDLHSCH
jgi:hypothetical protein